MKINWTKEDIIIFGIDSLISENTLFIANSCVYYDQAILQSEIVSNSRVWLKSYFFNEFYKSSDSFKIAKDSLKWHMQN